MAPRGGTFRRAEGSSIKRREWHQQEERFVEWRHVSLSGGEWRHKIFS